MSRTAATAAAPAMYHERRPAAIVGSDSPRSAGTACSNQPNPAGPGLRGRRAGVPAVCRPSEFVVQVDHAVERPRCCRTLGRYRGGRADAQFGYQRLDGAGQVAQLKMYVVLKGHKPRLGLIQAGYGIGSGLANLFEVCCLGLQLFERLFAAPPEHVRFTVQRLLERPDALIDVSSVWQVELFPDSVATDGARDEPIELGFEKERRC